MRGRDVALTQAVAAAAFALGCSRAPAPTPAPALTPALTHAPAPALEHAPAPAPACGAPGPVLLFTSPERPTAGKPLTVVAVADHAVDADLTLAVQGGAPTPAGERHGGPPYFWIAEAPAPMRKGKYTAALTRSAACGGAAIATKEIAIHDGPLAPAPLPRTALWRTRAAWSPELEDLYSAWVQHMFEAPLGATLSWAALHEVLRDPSRNFLFDYAGQAEDEQGIAVKPDCADLPYFLRAYFAFKLGLPFGWSTCTRGEDGQPPTCSNFVTSSDPFPPVDGGAPAPSWWTDPDRDAGPAQAPIERLGRFFRTTLADAVQSGAGRTRADDDETDYYPIALSAETLRPGTIFGDPYGHVLVVAQRIPQTPTSTGLLLAVDGQPDGTIARKRFWRGNFLFAIDPTLGSAGFKRFRPLVRDPATAGYRRLKNAEIDGYSATDQYAGGVEGFYDKVDDVLSPAPLDPTQAMLETIQALQEQVETRVASVENGRRFLASGKGVAEMPEGAKIFETNGDWEDFSTPSRDLRMLVAIDVALAFPARVARRADRYAMPPGEGVDRVRRDLEARLDHELHDRKFRYTRTDGSAWELSLRDVVEREGALETAYDPNDCVETRWGAPEGSAEASTCQAHAPADQVAKMQGYRIWFHDRRRPPR